MIMKTIKYFVFNGLFLWGLLYATSSGSVGMTNIMVMVISVLFVLSFCFLMDASSDKVFTKSIIGKVVPRWFDVTFDVMIIMLLAWHAWVVCCIMYVTHLFLIQGAYTNWLKRVEKERAEEAE